MSYCTVTLTKENEEQRHFEFKGCDLSLLDKPYENFPPSLFIIGAHRTWTTVLAQWLILNTELEIGISREPKFLSFRPDFFKRTHIQEFAYRQYEAFFKNASGPTIDATPIYYAFGNFIITNLRYTLSESVQYMPKMVFILRNPLSRLYSQYQARKILSRTKGNDLYKTKVPSLESLIEFDLKTLRDCGMDVKLDDPYFDPRDWSDDLLYCFTEFSMPLSEMYLVKGLYA